MQLPPQIVLEEFLRRRHKHFSPPDFLCAVQSPEFPEQNAFILDPSQFIDALTTRRAGKTTGLARRFLRTMAKYPGEQCRYIALTRDSAKDIMWPILQEEDERFKLGARFYESTLGAVPKLMEI